MVFGLFLMAAAVALLVYFRPLAGLVALAGILGVWLMLVQDDLNSLSALSKRSRIGNQESEADYYAKFEPKPKTSLILGGFSIALFVASWVFGWFAPIPDNSPTTTVLQSNHRRF